VPNPRPANPDVEVLVDRNAESRARAEQRRAAGRPDIHITTEERKVNDQAVRALARDAAIYQRGGQLVRVIRDTSAAAHGGIIRQPLSPRIDALPLAALRELLAEVARWIQVKAMRDKEIEVAAHPPGWCVSAVHVRGSWPGVRHLEGVVDYPILRPDGTILAKPGYDCATGLLLDLRNTAPTIPDRPTVAQATAACKRLFEVVVDFPFARPIHRAAWLASLLTPLARFAFRGAAPLFLVDANVPAAGKGLLVDVSSHILIGDQFARATYTNDDDEMRKRITSLVLEGDRLVLFDNLDGKFGGPVLDAALTATAWKDRLLGVNRTGSAPVYLTWYATGNNVAIGADTARRICHVRLESPLEKPEERQGFRHPNLLAYVRQHRQQLLGAALTILRAYVVAGRPDMRLPAWGSYEGWSALVRAAIVWAGQPDPGETRIVLRDSADLAVASVPVIIDCLARLDPDRRGLTAAEVIALVRPRAGKAATSEPEPPAWHADLRGAIEGLCGNLDARSLGNRLRSYRKRVFDGRYLDQAGKAHQAVRWAVYNASEFGQRSRSGPRGESGESGESVYPRRPAREDLDPNDPMAL